MEAYVNETKQIQGLERQCEIEMQLFERNFNYSESQEVLRNILSSINIIKQKVSSNDSLNSSAHECSQEREEVVVITTVSELQIKIQMVEARVYECIGNIYLSLSLGNQSISVFQKASHITSQIEQAQSKQVSQNLHQKHVRLIARLLIKSSFSLFLLSEQKSSYALLRDAHTFLKTNELLDSEEEALLQFNFGNYYRFIFQDDLSETCYSRCIAIREALFTKTSPILYDSKQELAKLYIESGQFSQAEKLLNEVITFKEDYYGECSPSTSVAYLYRANLQFITSSNVDSAQQDVLHSLSINTLFLGQTNKYNAECYLLLAQIMAKKHSHKQQLAQNSSFNKLQASPFSWSQYKATSSNSSSSSSSSSPPYSSFSQSSQSSSSSYSSYSSPSSSQQSSLQYSPKQHDIEYKNVQNTLNIQELQYNSYTYSLENQFIMHNQYNDILYNQQLSDIDSDLERCMICFNKAIDILKCLFGEYNGCVGIAYNTIGKVLLSLKLYEKALSCFNLSIHIYSRNPQSDFTICSYFATKNAAECNMKLARHKTAHQLYQSILQFKDQFNTLFHKQPCQHELEIKSQNLISGEYNNPLYQQQQQQQDKSDQNYQTIEEDHKKQFVIPVDINSQQIIQLLNQSRTED